MRGRRRKRANSEPSCTFVKKSIPAEGSPILHNSGHKPLLDHGWCEDTCGVKNHTSPCRTNRIAHNIHPQLAAAQHVAASASALMSPNYHRCSVAKQ